MLQFSNSKLLLLNDVDSLVKLKKCFNQIVLYTCSCRCINVIKSEGEINL